MNTCMSFRACEPPSFTCILSLYHSLYCISMQVDKVNSLCDVMESMAYHFSLTVHIASLLHGRYFKNIDVCNTPATSRIQVRVHCEHYSNTTYMYMYLYDCYGLFKLCKKSLNKIFIYIYFLSKTLIYHAFMYCIMFHI